MTDPIADMLTRMRNALLLRKQAVEMPYSKLKHEIAKILERDGWVAQVEKREDVRPVLWIALKYREDGSPAIQRVQRISTPGRRVYVGKHELPRVLSGFGIAVLSTSSGLMTNKEARRKGVGGELLCEVA